MGMCCHFSPQPPSLREGGGDMEDCTDQLEDCIGLFKHLLVGEAQDGDAPTAEEESRSLSCR